MHWFGIAALLIGAVLAFLVSGDLTLTGYLVMGLGALLVAAGALRLGRARRRALPSGTVADAGYRTGTGKIVAMVAAALYILSPLDIIPDVLLPVGVVDDATAFGWLVFALGQEVARRRRAGRPGSPPLPPR